VIILADDVITLPKYEDNMEGNICKLHKRFDEYNFVTDGQKGNGIIWDYKERGKLDQKKNLIRSDSRTSLSL
jgi:hypothetical protein